MTHLLPGGSYKYSVIATIVTYGLAVCNKKRKNHPNGWFFSFMAEDNAPHYVRRSYGHLPTVGRFPSLSGFAIQLKLGKSGMGLSHPLRGFSFHAILRDNKKRTTRLDSSFFIMAEDNAPHFVRHSYGHLPTVGRFPSLSHFPSKSP